MRTRLWYAADCPPPEYPIGIILLLALRRLLTRWIAYALTA